MERLTPRVRVVWLVVAGIRAAIVGALIVGGAIAVSSTGVWASEPDWFVPAAVGLAVVLAAVRVLVAWFRYSVWRFEIQDDGLYIERGVFTRVKTVVPYVRVQHVDSRRSPIERTTGLATMVVYTAGSRSADVAIPGLTPERANGLREELRRLAIESEGEDAV
ncbi:PH domain-containing protein [Halosolutus amylolyticus]|uniref:PH domain-containing protein n=1 Tax=Halosolutus amylolyticus TaxID=2932267 RepID=A0ABD5PMQ1_9EURY|nr:PH domain-containing protein [Halosolutus amylolyticus]